MTAEQFVRKYYFITDDEDLKEINIPFKYVVRLIETYQKHQMDERFNDKLINEVAERIKNEFNKHSKLEKWELIAARKINSIYKEILR